MRMDRIYSDFPSEVAKGICIASFHRFILHILIVIIIAWGKKSDG
jgi:hypothetical protein